MSDAPPPPHPPTAGRVPPPTPGPVPDQVTVDLTFGRRQQLTYAAGIACVGLLGAGFVLAGVTAGGWGWALAAVGTAIAGGAVALFRLRKRVFAPRSLTFDARGIRQAAVDHRAFQVEWSELAEARISYARKPGTVRSPVTWGGITADAPPGQDPQAHWGVSTFVRLDLVPADADFLDRHPDLARFRRATDRPEGEPGSSTAAPAWADDVGGGQAIVRIPFGDMPQLASEVDAGLRRFAGARYRAPVNEGLAWGFKYS